MRAVQLARHVCPVFLARTTGVAQFEMLCKMFYFLSLCWKKQLMDASSDGVTEMTGATCDIITFVQQDSPGGFYRV